MSPGMPSIVLYLALLSILFLASIQTSECVKDTYDKTSSGQFGSYVQKSFGMAIGGYIDLQYSVTAQNSSLPYDSYVLLLIINDKQRENYYSTLDDSESDIVGAMSSLCNYPSVVRIAAAVGQPDQIKLDITQSLGGSDLYSIVILQCRSGLASNPITVSIQSDMLNIRPSGDGVSHLAIEDVNMTRVYQGLIIMYSLLLLGLLAQFYYGSRGDRSFVLPIHSFFLVTLCLKLIVICLLHYDYFYYNEHGETSFSVQVAADFFRAITTASALCTLFLMSLGWSLLREQLAFKEYRFVVCCMFSYLFFALISAGCTDEASASCQSLFLVSFVIRSLILLVIIIAMNFTVTQLRAMLIHTPWVPSTPLQYARCKQYQMFRMAFIIYLLLPTVFLLISVTTLSWKEDWVVTTLNELTELLFFFHVGVTFSPLYEPLLVRAFDGSLARTE